MRLVLDNMEYIYLNDIGRGAFAKVDKVASSDAKEFARKTFDPLENILTNVGEESLKRRFTREVEYQKRIIHPNVMSITEDFLEEEPPYFIMPLAICSLKDELYDNGGQCNEPKKVLFDILAGLEAIHGNSYHHRDLKPANILKLKNDDGEINYVISDFGLISGINGESSTLTGSNAQGGTENYAAPELIRNMKRATFSADIYSFGAILHDIFGLGINRIPYTELSLSGPIGKIIEKCTKRLPLRRYSSVSELREDLYNVLNTADISYTSNQEEEVVSILETKDELTDEEWDKVFLLLEEGTARNIFNAISETHIVKLSKEAPELLSALGLDFCEYIQSRKFDFDQCDILASKAEKFYELGNIGLQAQVVIALLKLGTSHNRWYVEHKVIKLASKSISETLAERIKTEIEVSGINFVSQMKHLEKSIGVDIERIHPILIEFLNGNE